MAPGSHGPTSGVDYSRVDGVGPVLKRGFVTSRSTLTTMKMIDTTTNRAILCLRMFLPGDGRQLLKAPVQIRVSLRLNLRGLRDLFNSGFLWLQPERYARGTLDVALPFKAPGRSGNV
jgi:hypothetical protein